MGAPWAPDSGILMPGVGCVNKCRFCATSHFFGSYIPYLKTGREIFDVCCRYEDERNITDFGVLDENFLKMKDRALELLELMESHQRRFTFAIFSSAETIKEIKDLDILVRLGVNFIWIGVESKRQLYAKNKDTDFKILLSELRKRGISVLASLILFTEEHDKKTIWEDVDFVTSLNADYVQFSPLGPIPGTRLYEEYEREGKVIRDVPYESQHGLGKIWFRHDHFSREESEEFLRLAFEIDYNRNGASMLRNMKTTLAGYAYCRNHPDRVIRERAKGFKKRLQVMRYFLTASTLFVQNRQSEILLREIKKSFRRQLGRTRPLGLAVSLLVLLYSIKEYLRCRIVGDARMPKTSYRPLNGVCKTEATPERSPELATAATNAAYGWSEQPGH
jgi:radical SAM superfamily enzyme YgiQ (UPF0313 family)